MDPFFVSFAIAVATGMSAVAGKLVEKGVDALLEPAANGIKQRVQSGVKAIERDNALIRAITAAIEQAVGQADESLAIQYAQRLHLHELVEPGNESVRDEVMRLVFMASSNDPRIVPDSLLDALHLGAQQRPALARFLFLLRRQLAVLPDFQLLLNIAHQQHVEAALQELTFNLSTLSRTVERTSEGEALRVRVVADWNPEPYLRFLASESNRLRLSAIDPQYVTLTGESKITLVQVYTDLEVETIAKSKKSREALGGYLRAVTVTPNSLGVGDRELAISVFPTGAEGGKNFPLDALGHEAINQQILFEAEGHRRVTALEAVADPKEPHVVLLGAPGAGKSTFANYLTFCLTMANLDAGKGWLERLGGWTLGTLLPVRVILRDLAAWVDTDPVFNRKATAQTIWDFIRYDLTENGFADSFEPLKKCLQERGGLIVFDGLDEVPDAEERREFTKMAIESFARACGLCRTIVTCRPYAYQDPRWKLEDFVIHSIASFSGVQIETFVKRWYETIAPIQGWNLDFAQNKATELIAAVAQPYLAQLANRPLLLTLMATLHTSRGKLPDDRADLYEDCIALMLDYWQRGKETVIRGKAQIEDGLLTVLGISRDDLESALSHVALEAHRRQALQMDRKPETANITGDELRHTLAPALGNSLDKANTVIYYIQTRAGLLAEQGADVYTFPHRTFQEFLAACNVLNSEDFPINLSEWVCADRSWWREVFLLAAGRSRKRNFGQAVALINALCDKDYDTHQNVSDSDAYAAMLAAQAAVEVRLREHAQMPGRYQNTMRKLQNWLIGIIGQGALPALERAEVGRILSVLGDSRPDVSCPIPTLVIVPGSEFIMGSENHGDYERPTHRIALAEYYIGKYPVTNAQYRHFFEDGGYTEKRHEYWTQAGWLWLKANKLQRPIYLDNSEWNLDNHPVVGVSWYEAVAYCNWLTRIDPEHRVFRLPTEPEWEKAARGVDDREYPWGNVFDFMQANIAETGIGRTTAVGLFPQGKTPFELLDMAGNVWEWCSSSCGTDWMDLGSQYPYCASDGREELLGTNMRIRRGGSFHASRDDARCSYRGRLAPETQYDSVGFRVVAQTRTVA